MSYYFILINLAGFLLMWLDKRRAQKGLWRVSESTLFLVALAGGSIGSLIGMHKFRHKTRKKRFLFGIPLILAGQGALLIWIL